MCKNTSIYSVIQFISVSLFFINTPGFMWYVLHLLITRVVAKLWKYCRLLKQHKIFFCKIKHNNNSVSLLSLVRREKDVFFCKHVLIKMTMWYYVTCVLSHTQQETSKTAADWLRVKKDCKVKRKWNFYVYTIMTVCVCCFHCRRRRLRRCSRFRHITIFCFIFYYCW